MDDGDVPPDGAVSIEVGEGTSRRDVLKRVGAVGGVTAGAGSAVAAGEGSAAADTGDGTTATAETTDGEPGSSGVVRSARRYPAVAPPGWDASDTESGAGDTERTALLALGNGANPFFVPIAVGFHDALNTYGWTGQAVARPFGPPTLQPTLIESLIEDRLGPGDVLAMTIHDKSKFNDVIQQALDKGIVVVNTYRTPHPKDWNHEFMRNEANGSGFRYRDRPTIVPRVGIDEGRAGAAMAAEGYERLQRTNPDPEGGEYTALITNGHDRDPSVTRRVDASVADRGTAQRYLENRSDPSVTLYGDTIFSDEIDPNASSAESQIESTIAGDEAEIDAVLSAGYWGAVGAGKLIDEGVLPEDVIIGGFDLDQRMIDSIRNGFTDFAVVQDPYGQGYRSASLAWTYLERGIPMRDLEVGVSVFDESNIVFGDERRSWSDLRQWQRRNFDGLTY
jgi:ABC-type sugar transport system substrate-binding protein